MQAQTLSQYLNATMSLDVPGTYEFFEIESIDDMSRRFIIKNILNGRSILIYSKQNRVEIDQEFQNFNNINSRKISIIKFFERLKGLGIEYIDSSKS